MKRAPVMGLVWAVVVSAGCGDGAVMDGTQPGRGDGPAASLVVYAASSLTAVFTELEPAFEAAHDGVDVQLQFGASTALARQVGDGAPADVLAVTDRESLDGAHPYVGTPTVFARNRLEIVVERGNPKGVRSLADLARSDVKAITCASEVPCGRLADAALRRAHVQLRPASREENVKAVLSKVTLGEADAGIVFATDVQAAGRSATGVAVEGAEHPTLQAVYFASVVKRSTRVEHARQWVAFLASPPAQAILLAAGFLSP